MPIKAENKARYPAHWPQIRQDILKRADWTCEHPGCTARQKAYGFWMQDKFVELEWISASNSFALVRLERNASFYRALSFSLEYDNYDRHTCNGTPPKALPVAHWIFIDKSLHSESTFAPHGIFKSKVIRIILTIAHLDHTPENCAPNNLRAWCQRHHLRYDAEHHLQTAYATRKAKANTPDLFEPPL